MSGAFFIFSSGAFGTEPGDNQVYFLGHKPVASAQVKPDLINQVSFVMVDFPA